MNANLPRWSRTIKDLKEENERLKLDAAHWEITKTRLENEIERLQAEIRELTSECARFHKPA